ncbi:hypothetical protein PLICRDRAFT_45947 [Plicaturopsis crispa FD-325 SS-3]|uniref:Uncharacterized protein n=1 Tax=Plicaturopsis crispa FD-325 SS-3 TaxID=944288 RepID=A0A0C9SRD5_PLICR|nr:hypothetical protein PLICRDRAFT_45947 [Plicaturopsis crispa FD-325 SS-3]
MNDDSVTSQSHNEFVGSDNANSARVPGSEGAATGHTFVSVFPKDASGETMGRAGDWEHPGKKTQGQKDESEKEETQS